MGRLPAGFLVCSLILCAQQTHRVDPPPDLSGVYQAIPNSRTLPGGLKNSGSPSEIVLLPPAVAQMKTVNLKEDPWRLCQPVGEFRMMARERAKFELVPESGILVMLFEDVAHGLLRTIYLKRSHAERSLVGSAPDSGPNTTTWFGDSVAHWEKDTLVVDTIGFNTRTWLNDAGAQHSEALHLIEHIRPILKGQFLEYEMTAADPMALAKPYTYRRYFEKLSTEIGENVCRDAE